VNTVLPLVAAAAWTDAVVLAAVAVGATIGLTGIASFDPRVRGRLPLAVLARGNVTVSLGLVALGLLIVAIALGVGEG
jgi:hypothetical protein